jgi:hypothetical protein
MRATSATEAPVEEPGDIDHPRHEDRDGREGELSGCVDIAPHAGDHSPDDETQAQQIQWISEHGMPIAEAQARHDLAPPSPRHGMPGDGSSLPITSGGRSPSPW